MTSIVAVANLLVLASFCRGKARGETGSEGLAKGRMRPGPTNRSIYVTMTRNHDQHGNGGGCATHQNTRLFLFPRWQEQRRPRFPPGQCSAALFPPIVTQFPAFQHLADGDLTTSSVPQNLPCFTTFPPGGRAGMATFLH